MGDVVIGMAEGYSPQQISPFLASLRRTGYAGDIVLLMSAVPPAHSELARIHGARVFALRDLLPTSPPIRRAATAAVHHLAARRLSALPLVMWLPRLVDAAAARVGRRTRAQMHAVANLYPIALARYPYYLAYLERDAVGCERVLLSDVRDVVFQDDPFTRFAGHTGLHVFAEDDGITLGRCPYNAQWLSLGYGRGVVGELYDRSIMCSGVTFGDRRSIVEYLRRMIDELSGLRCAGVGADQSSHNVLVHLRGMPVTCHTNGAGPVYTMGYVSPDDLTWDERSRLVTRSGAAYAILHQYDRHLGLSVDPQTGRAIAASRDA